MMAGMVMQAVMPAAKAAVILAIFVYSLGDHSCVSEMPRSFASSIRSVAAWFSMVMNSMFASMVLP